MILLLCCSLFSVVMLSTNDDISSQNVGENKIVRHQATLRKFDYRSYVVNNEFEQQMDEQLQLILLRDTSGGGNETNIVSDNKSKEYHDWSRYKQKYGHSTAYSLIYFYL